MTGVPVADADPATILRAGPWQHRFVPANGARFHVAEAGEGDAPLIMLLHAFPQMWWAWRHQIEPLTAAGYRVAAMDLRGFGASDKPPHGYDTGGMARDVNGVIRSLGAADAVVVGHGLGGSVAWSMPTLFPAVTRAIAALAAPHPLHLRSTLRAAAGPGVLRNLAKFQVPFWPERLLRNNDLAVRLLRDWGAPGWLDDETAQVYRDAVRVPFVAYGALEPYRWLVRSIPRVDGRRYVAGVRGKVAVPALQLHGGADRCLRVQFARTPQRYLGSSFDYQVIAEAGHFLPEEAPEAVTTALLNWLADVDPVP